MDQCLEVGLPLASACSGRGACGKCLLTVLKGGQAMEPPTLEEAVLLAKLGAQKDQRLACQCHPPSPLADLVVTTGYW